MNKQMLVIYVGISVFSLLIIILSYIGYMRYMQLSLCSCETYAKKYEKLPRVKSNDKVIISIYLEKDDLEEIKSSMNSLLDQTVHPDQIIISTPPGKDIKVPEYIKKNKIVTIHKLHEDYGKSSNFISPFLREKDGNTKIILVTDEQVYGPDFIETLVDESENYPDSIIYVSGYNARVFSETKKKIDMNNENDIIDISKGVLIKPIFFDSTVIDLEDENSPENIKNTPNLLLSLNAHKNNIKLHKVDYKENINREINGGGTKKREESLEKNISPYYAIHFPSFK